MATAEGVIERVPNPAPLARDLTVPRRRSRSLSRSQRGSNRCRRKERRRARLQAHLAALRRHEIPRLTTRPAHNPRPDRGGLREPLQTAKDAPFDLELLGARHDHQASPCRRLSKCRVTGLTGASSPPSRAGTAVPERGR